MIICPNLKNPDVAREFNELKEATSEAAAYRIWSLNNGNGIDKAPNGAESKLFQDLLDYHKNDRKKAIRAKASLFSASFLRQFGDWVSGDEILTVYQGTDKQEFDDRKYNYWTIDEKEAKNNYGPTVRKRVINTKGFLNKVELVFEENGPELNWSEEYKQIHEEFRQKTGKFFDILDNRPEGLAVQEEFFKFVESKGYLGYREYNQDAIDNQYVVTFGNIGNMSRKLDENGEPVLKYATRQYIRDINQNVREQIVEFCDRLGFQIQQSDADTFIDFASKIINISDFDSYEFDKVKAKIATVLMPTKLNEKIRSVGKKNSVGRIKGFTEKEVDAEIERDILDAIREQKNYITEDKSLYREIIDFIKQLIDKFLKNQNYYERLIYQAAQDISDINSSYYRTVIQKGFEQKNLSLDTLKRSPLYNIYEVLTNLGASLDGSAAVRAQGTLYRKDEENFHDMDFTKPYDSFSWDVYNELQDFFTNYKVATNNFANRDKNIYRDLRQHMLENCEEHLKESEIYKELSKHYKEIHVKHAAKTSQLGLFVTLLVDGNPIDIFYNRNVEQHEINGIKVTDFSVAFAAKLVMRRDKDIRDIINFHKFGDTTSDSEQMQLNPVQQSLAQAFDLVQQEDGSWETDSKSPFAKLRVQFVNDLTNAGEYTHNSRADAMYHLIKIGLSHGDATTFNHELAHHYIRVFWNSEIVQKALQIVYKKSMGDINDPKVREAVEEKLVEMMTERSVDDMFKSNIEHQSFFQKFWEKFNTMLYAVFNIKNSVARKALVDTVTKHFIENDQLINDADQVSIQMYEGTVYQKSTYKQRINKTSSIETYNIHDITRNDEEVTKRIVDATQSKERAYKHRSRIGEANGIYGDIDQMARNQEAVRQVRKQKALIEEAHLAGNAQVELHEKSKLFKSFIESGHEELSHMIQLFANAHANKFQKMMYVIDGAGNKQYVLPSGEQITDQNAPIGVQSQQFGFDELQYAAEDVTGFIGPIVKAIIGVIQDARMLGYTDSDITSIEDAIRNSKIEQQINDITSYYNTALKDRLFKWIDDVVDDREELNDDFKNRLRINMKKWILEQQDFGDVNIIETLVGMGSHSKSPIIRAMQNMINDMQQERDQATYKKGIALMEKKRKAEKSLGLKYRILPYNFQKLLMQLDRRGLPTGYFISEINRGQYLQDRDDYINGLLFGNKNNIGLEKELKALKDANGNPIYVDPQGKPIKELTFDEYGFPIVPKNDQAERLVKDYLIAVEMWKSNHSNRRFTGKYYIERIEYLSIDALRALHRINSKLDAIVSAVTINGVPRMDLLTEDQQDEYITYQNEKDFLGSIYNQDGSLKDPDSEEYAIAESIRNFRVHMKDKISYKADMNAYNESYNNAKNKAAFAKRFIHWQVNPKIFEYLRQKSVDRPESDPDVQALAGLQYDKMKLVHQFFGESIGEIYWDEIYDKNAKRLKNEQFWKTLNYLDEQINAHQVLLANRYGKNSDLFDAIMKTYFIPVDRSQNWATADTMFETMYRDIKDSIYSDPNMTQQEKNAEWFKQLNMLEYYCTSKDMNKPVSIFTIMLPRNQYTLNVDTGEQYKDYVQVPHSVFQVVDVKNSDKEYVNENFNEQDSNFEQPIESQYKDQRYDKYIKGNAELKELLDDLRNTMSEQSWKKIPFLGSYDDRLPQIGARNGQIMGRKMFSRFGSNFMQMLRREWEVVETDLQFAPDSDTLKRPDGSPIRNIPVRFVKMLERPEYISSDVVGSVIQFFDMAENYRLKSKNASLLTQIMAQLRHPESSNNSKTSKQYRVIEDILSKQLYEDNSGLDNYDSKDEGRKWKRADWLRKALLVGGSKAWVKRIGKARASLQIGTLAFNLSSAIVSFLDPLLSLIVDTATGRYINVWNDLQAVRFLFGNSILSLFSLGKVKSYGKLGAAMQKMQLSKSNRETFSDTDKGQVYRFLSDGLKMKLFSFGDYTMNAITLMATMDNYRAYRDVNGVVVDFLPKTLYIQRYMKEFNCDANVARSKYRSAKSMWNSCKVNRSTGEFVAAENEYGAAISENTWTAVRKQVRSRASMYNGIVPDVERTMMQNHPFFSFLTVLRNFMITGIWERFNSHRDFQVTTFDQNGEPSITNISNRVDRSDVKYKQRYYKGGLNFDTRTVEDGVFACMGNWLGHMLPYAKFMFKSFASPFMTKYNSKLRNVRSLEFEDYLKSNKLNRNSIYSAQRVFLEIMIIALLWSLVPVAKRLADEYKDNYFLQFLNLITLRIAIERTTWFSPNTFLDLIQSPTALYSDWKRRLKIINLITESIGLSDYNSNDKMKTGNFTGMKRWKYNLLSALSGFGSHNWYTNMPEFAWGGGAKAVRRKEGFYHTLTPSWLRNWIYDKKDDTKKKKKSRSRSRNRSRNHRRSRD